MKARVLTMAVGLVTVAGVSITHAADMPAMPSAPAAGAAAVPGTPAPAAGGGIKELPGTVEKDVSDAVKKDVTGMMPGAKEPAAGATDKGAAGSPADTDDEVDDEDDAE